MRSKKGIQPIVATLLLIILASGLGIIVMNFGRAQIEIAAQCAVDIGLDFVELNGKDQVCIDNPNNQLFFIIENGPQIEVESLRLRAIGEKDVFVQDLAGSAIERTDALLRYVPYNVNDFGSVRQLRLIPRVSLYDEVITCPEQAITIEDVRQCES